MRKRKIPPPQPNNSPISAKKNPVKRSRKKDRPNGFMTHDHFVPTPLNEVVLNRSDEVKTIQDFRLFFSEDKTRCVSFMMNTFKGKNEQLISIPTIFFSNYWMEKKENLKNPLTNDGHRESTAKFKPRDIPAIIEAMQCVMKMNPLIFKQSQDEENFKSDAFISRIKNSVPALSKEAEVEELPALVDINENIAN